jgi:HAD superfamily hydrolase (TIGR01509 family)
LHIAAAIFDLDGCLVTTADQHERAWRQALEPLKLTHDAFLKHFDGRTREQGLLSFLASIGSQANSSWMRDVMAGKDAIYRELLRSEGIEVHGDARTLLSLLTCPLAITSSSKNAKAVIRAAGLSDRFKVVIDGNGVSKPECYTAAAEALGVPFSECMVVEDSPECLAQAIALGPKYGLFVRKDR